MIKPLLSLVDPTLPLESDIHQVVESIPSSINPTLPSKSEVSTSHILFTVNLELSKQGGTDFISNEPPPSSHISSFDWNSLVESFLPSNAPFQIKVEFGQYTIALCIVDEGASVSILSSHAWQGMGSPRLM